MNQQSVVTFNSHESRSVNTRNGQRTVNTFTTTEGTKFQCWDAPLSSQIFGLLNQPVTVEYETRVNGQYTNYEIRGIAAANGVAPAALAGVGAPAPTATAGAVPSVASPAPAPAPQSNQGDAQAQRITRSFGVNAALKALEIAAGDQAGAEQVLKAAVELAFIPASFAWAGPQQDKPVVAPPAPVEDLGIPVA